MHRHAPNQELKEFEAKMNRYPFFLPDFDGVWAYVVGSADEIPGQSMSFSDSAQTKSLPFRFDLPKAEGIAKFGAKVLSLVHGDDNKLSYDELMCAEVDNMGETDKKEHAMFKLQYGILQDGLFHLVLNPRKHEAIDVFIVLPDGRVVLVSNKHVNLSYHGHTRTIPCRGISL